MFLQVPADRMKRPPGRSLLSPVLEDPQPQTLYCRVALSCS